MRTDTSTRTVLTFGAAVIAASAAWVERAPAQESDTLVIARDMDVDSLDPGRAWCDTCQIYLSSVYETLVGLAPDNRTLVAGLAESWEVSDDQTQFTFHLQPDAVFADGSPVEAKDVKWSWERLRNLKSGASFFMDPVQSLETPDAKTVVVTLSAPNSEFLGIMNAPYTGITNSDIAIEQGANADEDADASDTAEPWFLANSAGSGPFVLETYRPDDELRLARNESYWGDQPAFAQVVIRQTKDAVGQAQMLESGAADIAMQIDPDTAKSISSDEVTVETVPSFNFVYVALSPGAKGNQVPLTLPVREAFGYALDYDGIIDFTVGGEGDLQASPIPNGFPGTEGLPLPARDIEKAKALLAEAGVGDGFAIDAIYPNVNVYGVDFSIMMQKVQQDLAEVGIQANLQPVTFSVWRDHVSGDGAPLTAVYYAPDYFGSGQYVQYFAMDGESAWSTRAGAEREPSIINPREAELLAEALASGGEQQEKLYHELALEMIKDRIIFPLVSPNLVLAYRDDIEGVRYSACCNLPLAELSRK